jgi:hypothetical protein
MQSEYILRGGRQFNSGNVLMLWRKADDSEINPDHSADIFMIASPHSLGPRYLHPDFKTYYVNDFSLKNSKTGISL